MAMVFPTELFWIALGFAGQSCYFIRMLWQWLVSETKGRSVLPLGFWYWSIGGSLLLLAYACYRRDPVFIVGQTAGLIVYIRNVMLWQGEDVQPLAGPRPAEGQLAKERKRLAA
jgi:lipid-A-disaccharide synthase-like uncharacterized protein